MTQEHVDLAMATDPAMEVVRTAEAATSITKDTGELKQELDPHSAAHLSPLCGEGCGKARKMRERTYVVKTVLLP